MSGEGAGGPGYRRVAVVVNPAAGRGRALKRAKAAVDEFGRTGAAVELYRTRAAGDGRHFVIESGDRFDLLVAAGGDGTLGEIAGAAADSGCAAAVAPLPCGTVNVVARCLGYPFEPRELVRAWQMTRPRAFDLGVLDGADGLRRHFLICAGFGPDAEVIADVHVNRNGPIRLGDYAGPVFRALRRGERASARVTVDGGAPVAAVYGVAANFERYGGFLYPCPGADPSDGMLDVFHYRPPESTLGTWLRLAWSMRRKRAGASPGATTGRGRSVVWDAPAEARIPVQADGDLAGFLPVRLSVRAGAIRMPCLEEG